MSRSLAPKGNRFFFVGWGSLFNIAVPNVLAFHVS
jgi:hypothetical protein